MEPPTAKDAINFLVLFFSELSWFQIGLLVTAAVVWFRGVKIVGKMNSAREGTDGNDFNAREWSTLAAFAIVSLALGAIAIGLK